MNYKKIKKEEFEKLKKLFPDNEEIWQKYRKQRLEQFDKKEIDVFVIEDNNEIIGEITINYINHNLQTETILGKRVYLEAFRIDKNYQGKGLGQKLLNYVIDNLIQDGYTEFTIGVEKTNDIAKHIYFKLGFIEAIDKGHGDEFDPSDYILYLKKIDCYYNIKKLIKETNIGNKIITVDKVTGGLSHRMYKVVTDKGIYAVKELNPNVMKRKQAYSNFLFAEKVTDIAKMNGISAIGTNKINGKVIEEIDNNYFMIFDWKDGKILKNEEITEEHCKIIGKILAKIHNIDFSDIEDEKRKQINVEEFDWNKYLKVAECQNTTFATLLKDNISLLYELNKKANDGQIYAKTHLVISHTDLDRKNVIWQENIPFIIDWEASGYINPTIELIQVAWYWSDGDIGNLNYDKFKIIVEEYKKYYKGNIDKNIDKLIYADIYSGLAWVNYNLQRALCIECKCDKEEIELAENEIKCSIEEIIYNESQMKQMIKLLK